MLVIEHDPHSTEAARVLCMVLSEFGTFYMECGDAGDIENALDYYERALVVSKYLFELDPGSAIAVRGVVSSLVNCCKVMKRMGMEEEFESYLEASAEALRTFRSQVEKDGVEMTAQMQAVFRHLPSEPASATSEGNRSFF